MCLGLPPESPPPRDAALIEADAGLAARDPAQMGYHELKHYASAQGVTWYGFWSVAPCRTQYRRIWRQVYPEEREFLYRYFPAWFAGQDFSIRNAIISKRSRNLLGNNIVMAPNKYSNQGFHGGLSPIADTPTFGHELLHAMDRQLGGRMRIWRSYADRQAPDPRTGKVDESAYYEYDDSIRDPARMLAQFRALNPEAQGELFEEGVRRDLALRAAQAAGDAAALAEAAAAAAPYVEVLAFVRGLTRADSLRVD